MAPASALEGAGMARLVVVPARGDSQASAGRVRCFGISRSSCGGHAVAMRLRLAPAPSRGRPTRAVAIRACVLAPWGWRSRGARRWRCVGPAGLREQLTGDA